MGLKLRSNKMANHINWPTYSDWFVFRITKSQRMKKYAAIPGHQLQKDYVYVAAEIVVMYPSH